MKARLCNRGSVDYLNSGAIDLSGSVVAGAEPDVIGSGFLRSEIERSERMLSNEGFVAKAPAKLIEGEKEKLAKNQALLAELKK
jgi:valyl-tRNA synthetase